LQIRNKNAQIGPKKSERLQSRNRNRAPLIKSLCFRVNGTTLTKRSGMNI
jgi:hypothetical protein